MALPREIRLDLENRTAEFERVVAVLEAWQAEGALPAEAAHDGRLILEEAFTNIVKYAHRDGAPHRISVALALRDDRLDCTLEDDGQPFDPTDPKAIPTLASGQSIAQAPEGQLGLHLLRAFASSCQYERRGERNVLTLSKHFHFPAR